MTFKLADLSMAAADKKKSDLDDAKKMTDSSLPLTVSESCLEPLAMDNNMQKVSQFGLDL